MDKKWYTDVLMLNRDPNWYRLADCTDKETCRQWFEKYFSMYGDSVTDICICVFEQTALVPAKSFMWRGEKYLQKSENGADVDYSETHVALLYKCIAEFGLDPIQIFIDTVKKRGIRPWLTLRMNDVHYGKEETSPLRSDMFYEEREAGHIVNGNYRFHPIVYDFTYPRYREALLSYMVELFEKYDVFGLELDFMREFVCFDYKNNPDCHKIMTEYIKQVREIVKRAENRVGHSIKLSMRTCRSPKDSLAFGFDIKTLSDEGIIDAVIPTPHWNPTDSGIPIREWKALLGDKIPVFAGIEGNNFGFSVNTAANSRAYAAAFYAMGADGIYFNNHEFDSERNREVWKITRQNCLEGTREFVVNYQDCVAFPEERYRPLPLNVDGEAELPLEIGKVKTADKVNVIIDFEGDISPVICCGEVRDVPAERIEPLCTVRGDKTIEFTPHTPLSFNISGIVTESPVTLTFKGRGTVHYVKIAITANCE